jgi:hypothetical protein
MPPGADATGHFRENTAILSFAGGGLDAEKGRWFHENLISRRSLENPPVPGPEERDVPARRAMAEEQEEPGKEWCRMRRKMKGARRRRVRRAGEMESIGCEGHLGFLALGGELSRAIDHAVGEQARYAGMDALFGCRKKWRQQERGKKAGSGAFGAGGVKWSNLQAFDFTGTLHGCFPSLKLLTKAALHAIARDRMSSAVDFLYPEE